MAKKPTTCSNCNLPISEGQQSISAGSGQNNNRNVSFFHADAKGCSEASSASKAPLKADRSPKGRGSTGEGNRRATDVGRKTRRVNPSKMWEN